MTTSTLAGVIRHLVDSLDRLACAIDEAAADISTSTRRRQGARPVDLGTELDPRTWEAASTTGTRRAYGTAPPKVTKSGRPVAVGVREWAARQGIPVNARGRVPADIVDAFLASQRTTELEGEAV